MATSPPTRAERDKNLDTLKKAVTEWAEKEIQRLDQEAQFMRGVLQGRKAQKAATRNLASTSELVQAEIDDYLIFTPSP